MHPKIVNITPILNRYHAARYLALQARVQGAICIETAGKGPAHNLDWRSSIDRQKHNIRTLFPAKHYTDIPHRRRREAVWKELDAIGSDNIGAIIVLGWAFDESKAAVAWARRAGKAVVVTSDSTRDDRARSWFRECYKSRYVRLFDAALVSGARAKQYLAGLGMSPDRIFTGFDVVDNGHFQAASGTASVPEVVDLRSPYFLTVARLISEKNLSLALNAYARYYAISGADSWRWVICGDGPLHSELLTQCDQLRLRDKVTFAGNITHDEIPAFYAHASAFWLPSISETWGLAVNEAMCCRLSLLLSTSVGCVPDLLREGKNGWSFCPQSVESMSDLLLKMQRLSETERRQMGKTSEAIISQWDLNTFGENVLRAVHAATAFAATRPRRFNAIGRLLLRL